MKRALSLILAVVLIAASLTAPAYASQTQYEKTYLYNSDGGGSIANVSSSESISGFGGRASSDSSLRVCRTQSEGESSSNHKVQYRKTSLGEDLLSEIIVMGCSFYIQSNVKSFGLCGNGGVNISEYISTENSYIQDGWNKIAFVYDHSTAGSELGDYAGSWALFVNGSCINALGDNRREMTKENPFNYINANALTELRLVFNGIDGTELRLVADDAYMYTAEKTALDGVLAELSGSQPAIAAPTDGSYTVSDGRLLITGDTAVSSLNGVNCGEIRAYSNDEYSYLLSADDVLEDGNTVVVAGNGMYMRYIVSSTDNLIYSTTFRNGTYPEGMNASGKDYYIEEYVYGKAGKTANDASYNFRRAPGTGEASNWGGKNIYTFIYAPVDKSYIKYEINFMPGNEGFGHCAFKTQGHGTLSGNLFCKDSGTGANYCLERYQWNKIVYILNNKTTTPDTSTAELSATYNLYVNGEHIYTNRSVTPKKTNNSTTAENTPIRFAVYGTDTALEDGTHNYGEISCFIDDIDVRWYDEAPSVKPMPYAIDDGGETVTIENGIYTVYDDHRVSDIAVCPGGRLTVFDSVTYDYYLTEDNALFDDNLIIIADRYNQQTTYRVTREIRNNARITPFDGYYIASANLKDTTLILAGYDESNAVLAVDFVSGTGEKETRIDGEFEVVKAYVWSGFDSAKPVAEEKTYISAPSVACWGDSITFGSGSDNPDTDAYPAVLAELTGYTVYNMGVGGETQTTIAARQGGLDIKLTKDITIPASGSVDIEFAAYNSDGTYGGVVTPRKASQGGWTPMTINGVEGRLSIVLNTDVWPRILESATFTRNTAGEEVLAPAGTKIYTDAHSINETADISVIFAGVNGGWNSDNTLAKDEDYADLIILLDKMLASTKNPDKFVVIGLTTKEGDAWANTNAALAEKYGENFLDIKSCLVSEQALKDSGITPTETDIEWISAGHIPPSFINNPSPALDDTSGYDNVHLNTAGYAAIARYLYDKFVELGYCVEQ